MAKKLSKKNLVQPLEDELIKRTAAFCQKYLDREYEDLCRSLIEKMSRKREVPFRHGRLEIWAAAVVYAIGSMNFLFDKSFEPYCTTDQIAEFFGVSKNTLRQKAALIREMFKMQPFFNTEFSTQRMWEQNPFRRMALVDDMLLPIPPDL